MPLDVRPELAQRINDLPAAEVIDFVRERVRARDLHVVVRQLNNGVLSKKPGIADAAQRALSRIGFID